MNTDAVKLWFEELPGKLKKLPDTFNNLPNDEKIAWVCVMVGCMLIVTSLFFM